MTTSQFMPHRIGPPASTVLSGIHVVLVAVNVPGPVAASRLQSMGASVTKFEPPQGDPLYHIAPTWYDELHANIQVRRTNLKNVAAQAELANALASADLLITSFRPSSLVRLGLGAATLRQHHPSLCHVAIVGESGVRAEAAGHDFTYVARLGLVSPPAMPVTLLADLAGAERAVSAALALLLGRANHAASRHDEVSLAEAANVFAAPLTHHLTTADGPLGGSYPFYRCFRVLDGWIAVAALELQFAQKLLAVLELPEASHDTFSKIFASHSMAYWDAWAAEHDLPVAAIRSSAGATEFPTRE